MVSGKRASARAFYLGLLLIFSQALVFSLIIACVNPIPPVSEPPPPPPPPPPAEEPVWPSPPPPVPFPPLPPPVPAGPLMIRVGLATDLDRLDLPCCGPDLVLTDGDERMPLTTKMSLVPANVAVKNPIYRLQVASLKDERQAQGIALYLSQATGQKADAVFDADTDLYKVRFGAFATRDDANAELDQLAGLGVIQAWVASEGGELRNPGITVLPSAEKSTEEPTLEPIVVPGRWLTLEGLEDQGIAIHGGRYRGRILIYLNDRGLLNLINELEVEQYLRGVVPKEMGPELYNQIEALKAQTVAARTYAVRNLGEFSSEGYDICSTPRCQVYGGMKAEHRVSDRAITDTAGQVVLFDGQPAETFYGATCGGHTENVEVVFPLKSGAYLKGVPCMEMGASRIGASASGKGFPHALTERLLPTTDGDGPRVLSHRFGQLATLAELPMPRDQLDSLRRKEVARYLSSVFDMVLDPDMFLPGIEVDSSPPNWTARERRLTSHLRETLLQEEQAEMALTDDETENLLFELALFLRVLQHQETHFQSLEHDPEGGGETLLVRTERGRASWRLPDQVVTFRRQGESLVAVPLELTAGDRLEAYWHGDRIVGLIQPLVADPVSLRRHAPRQKWSHFVTRKKLRQAVQLRYPGFPFEGFEVLSRGVSGRVGKLRLLGAEGRQVLVEGLAVRWTLDIPDTNFQAQRNTERDGWQFKGRGWGHGVGMCQAGAFGMAKRHLNYREILEHYYSDIELGKVRQIRIHVRPHVGP